MAAAKISSSNAAKPTPPPPAPHPKSVSRKPKKRPKAHPGGRGSKGAFGGTGASMRRPFSPRKFGGAGTTAGAAATPATAAAPLSREGRQRKAQAEAEKAEEEKERRLAAGVPEEPPSAFMTILDEDRLVALGMPARPGPVRAFFGPLDPVAVHVVDRGRWSETVRVFFPDATRLRAARDLLRRSVELHRAGSPEGAHVAGAGFLYMDLSEDFVKEELKIDGGDDVRYCIRCLLGDHALVADVVPQPDKTARVFFPTDRDRRAAEAYYRSYRGVLARRDVLSKHLPCMLIQRTTLRLLDVRPTEAHVKALFAEFLPRGVETTHTGQFRVLFRGFEDRHTAFDSIRAEIARAAEAKARDKASAAIAATWLRRASPLPVVIVAPALLLQLADWTSVKPGAAQIKRFFRSFHVVGLREDRRGLWHVVCPVQSSAPWTAAGGDNGVGALGGLRSQTSKAAGKAARKAEKALKLGRSKSKKADREPSSIRPRILKYMLERRAQHEDKHEEQVKAAKLIQATHRSSPRNNVDESASMVAGSDGNTATTGTRANTGAGSGAGAGAGSGAARAGGGAGGRGNGTAAAGTNGVVAAAAAAGAGSTGAPAKAVAQKTVLVLTPALLASLGCSPGNFGQLDNLCALLHDHEIAESDVHLIDGGAAEVVFRDAAEKKAAVSMLAALRAEVSASHEGGHSGVAAAMAVEV